jgi:hypothetical protein
MRSGWRCLLVALVLIPTWAGADGASSSAPGPALSEEHRCRLDRREIVLFDVLPAGGDVRHSSGGTGLAVVYAAPATVWRILVDYAHHASLYPRVIDVAVVEETGSGAVVHCVVGIGPFSFGFHVTTQPEAARGRLAWRLARDRPNDLFRTVRDTGKWMPTPTGPLSPMRWPPAHSSPPSSSEVPSGTA